MRERQQTLRENTYDLSQALKEYDSEEALRFDRVQVADREIALKLTIDGRVVRNPAAAVTLHVYSPFQRALDPAIADDTAMGQRANADPNNLYLRLDDVKGLRDALALALATAQEADVVLSNPQSSPADQEVARQAKAQDLPSYRDEVRRLLALAVRNGAIFFRGTRYALTPAGSTAASVRETLAQPPLLPTIYSRFAELTHRVANEETAVKAALAGNSGNADLQALGVYRADGTLNESNALLSTLRGRLPLAEKDGGLLQASDLRDEMERPPYGWDGNAVKVGLALLLRASACRLAEAGKYITDPASPDALRLLTKEQSFKGLRVQGVKSDLDMETLKAVRAEMEALFGSKPSLVAATMHAELGKALAALGERAAAIGEWAKAAQCPLPQSFAAGRQLAEELVNTTAQVQRLRAFHEQAETLRGYCTLLDNLETFRKTLGEQFTQARDFYNRMLNANLEIPALRTFLDGWRVVTKEGSITEAPRWHEIDVAYRIAQQALTEQTAAWREQAQSELAELESALPERLREAGVPDEHWEEEYATLNRRFDHVRTLLEAAADPVAARGAVMALQELKLELPGALQELREKYRPLPADDEKHLSWHNLLSVTRIASREDLDALVSGLRGTIEPLLDNGQIVVIE